MSIAYEACFPWLIVISVDGTNILREKKNNGQIKLETNVA